MFAVRDELAHPLSNANLELRRGTTLGAHPGSAPCLTVLATTAEGTVSALKAASVLAQSLGAAIVLLKIEILPRHYPLEKSQAQFDFLERSARALVSSSGIRNENISVQVWLCRDEKKCLQRAISSRSLVVMGTKWHWWSKHEWKLQKWLSQHGHYVIPVDVNARTDVEMMTKSHGDSILCHVVKNLQTSQIAR
jgi:hypothetical protein